MSSRFGAGPSRMGRAPVVSSSVKENVPTNLSNKRTPSNGPNASSSLRTRKPLGVSTVAQSNNGRMNTSVASSSISRSISSVSSSFMSPSRMNTGMGVGPKSTVKANHDTPGTEAAIAALGLPSLSNTITGIFAGAASVREDFRNGYVTILDRKFPKKSFQNDLKVHESLVKQQLEDAKAALLDSVTRHTEAIQAAKHCESIIAARFAEATKLETTLATMTAGKEALAIELACIKQELAQSTADLSQALQNEEAANDEIREMHESVAKLESMLADRDADLATTKEEWATDRALLDGANDDIEELRAALQVAKSTATTEMASITAELERMKATACESASSSASSIATLSAERTRLTDQIKDAEAKTRETERLNDRIMLESDRLRGELANAVAAKTSAMDELERCRKTLESKENTVASTLESFNRSAELAMQREREAVIRSDGMHTLLVATQKERDDLRAEELRLKAEVRDSLAKETSLTNELNISQASLQSTSASLATLRTEATRMETELTMIRATLERVEAEALKDRLESAERISVLSGRVLEVDEKLRSSMEAEAVWRAREAEWRTRESEFVSGRDRQDVGMSALTSELRALKEAMGASMEDNTVKVAEQAKEMGTLRAQCRSLSEAQRKTAAAEAEATRLREELFLGEQSRRALHNQIQELKGNIRVYVRVRPFLPSDGIVSADPEVVEDEVAIDGEGEGDIPTDMNEEGEELLEDGEMEEEEMSLPSIPIATTAVPSSTNLVAAVSVSTDGTTIEMKPLASRGIKESVPGLKGVANKPLRLTFDHVFSPRDGQAEVFEEASHLVQSALDGYNVCIFTYGQTGSGKTHTMQGTTGDGAGLIPRSVKRILDTASRLSGQGWVYTVEASFLEIYNETVRDLLRMPTVVASNSNDSVTAAAASATLTVHQDGEGNVEVPGLTRTPIPDANAVDALLIKAAKRRSVAVTQMNAQSSRSHSVFTLYLRGVHAARGVAVNGALNLVDLAGSERLARSGAEGDRKKETAAINKSLSCLADVFTALAKKSPHIPFRNSKLTHLLAPCFRGDGKTMMLVNVSPTEASAFETTCSLRFASQVSQVELGKPRKRAMETLTPIPTTTTTSSNTTRVTSTNESVEESDMIQEDETTGAGLDNDDLEDGTELKTFTHASSRMNNMNRPTITNVKPRNTPSVTASSTTSITGQKRSLTMSSSAAMTSAALASRNLIGTTTSLSASSAAVPRSTSVTAPSVPMRRPSATVTALPSAASVTAALAAKRPKLMTSSINAAAR